MSIFPGNNLQPPFVKNKEEIFKEYAIDFNTGEFIYKNGKNIIVEKNDALKIWIWKTLKTAKNRYVAYSNKYGNELEKVIGKGYSRELTDTELQRLIKEALLQNKYIKNITNFNVITDGCKVNVQAKIITVYGEMDIDV